MPVVRVLMPQFGMGMQDGEILRWCKAVGDQVTAGEILAEVEAAKSVVEIPAPVSGELMAIAAEVGEVVAVRAVIAEMMVK